MNAMKKSLVGGALVSVLVATTPAKADVPVIDPTGLAEWAINIGNQLKSYALQLEAYTVQAKQYVGEQLSWITQGNAYATQLQQYDNQLQTFLNFYHNPSLGAAMGLFSMAGLTSGMPVNPYAVMGLVGGFQYGSGGLPQIQGILGSLSGFTTSSYNTAHVYTPTDGSWASQQLIARGNGIAGAEGAAQTAYGDLQTHGATLQPLRDNMLAAKDTKSVLDATAQTNLEIAWNVNALAKQQAISAAYEAHKDSVVQRDNEKLSKDIEAFVATAPAPTP